MPPSPTPYGWSDAYAFAAAFRELAPWRWMSDSVVFGVQDPASERIGWCIVLGAGEEVFGLAVYRGDRGFHTLRLVSERENQQYDEEIFEADSLLFFLGDREEVPRDQWLRIRELGLKFRGRGAWPAFCDTRPERGTSDVPDEEVPFLASCMEQALGVAERARTEPESVLPSASGELVVRVWSGAQDAWIDERRPEPEPPEVVVPELDARDMHTLKRRCQATTAALELDVFPLPGSMVDDDGIPFTAAMLLIVDARTGFILVSELGRPEARLETAQDELLRVIEGSGQIPACVTVRQHSVQKALEPIAAALGFELAFAHELPALGEARESMVGMMRQGLL